MEREGETENLQYLIPARTLSGSARDVLGQLDELILALEAMRESLATSAAIRAITARDRRSGTPPRAR